MKNNENIQDALKLLDLHHDSFFGVADIATRTGHPVPVDTRGWSQILVSLLCGINGLDRKKGADLSDGSDVKGANTWKAIDTPRFNGVIKAGTKSAKAGTIESLDEMPHLFLVLWDNAPISNNPRCRIWCVRTQKDPIFRKICQLWYDKSSAGEIKSTNFQLHPPRGKDSNVIRNTCGNLEYPLYFHAERPKDSQYQIIHFNPDTLDLGLCTVIPD